MTSTSIGNLAGGVPAGSGAVKIGAGESAAFGCRIKLG